jgi:vacuolar protein sorting-associated protein 13A/C
MSCVKVRQRATNQKVAYLSYAGIAQNQKYNDQEDDDTSLCYETYLIFYPVFKITNATVRRLHLYYGISSSSEKQRKNLQAARADGGDQLDRSTVFPGDSFLCYKLDFSEDILLQLSFENFEKTKEIKIFQRWFMFGEKRSKFDIAFKRKRMKSKYLYLFAQMTKLSQKTREIVIYCPYLIMNETDKALVYREHGLAQDIVSIDEI